MDSSVYAYQAQTLLCLLASFLNGSLVKCNGIHMQKQQFSMAQLQGHNADDNWKVHG